MGKKVKNIIAFKNGKVVTSEKTIEQGVVLIEDEHIIAVGQKDKVKIPRDVQIIDVSGKIIAPGFIDIHVHGGGGSDVLDGSYEDINQMVKFHAKHGITSLLPTIPVAPHEDLLKSVKVIRQAMERGTEGAEVLGVYLEGPYISLEKKGAQRAEHIRPPSLEEFHQLVKASGNNVKIITIAPEVKGAIDFITEVCRMGIVASAGHTNATYDEFVAGINAGVSHATHTFNAMTGFHHRAPGAVGAILTHNEVMAELIGDNVHVHSPAMEVLIKCKGTDKVTLITDAIKVAGMPDGVYMVHGQERVISKGISRIKKTGAWPAGSLATLNICVKNMVKLIGLSLNEGIKLATINPAKSIHVDDKKGSLKPGKDADIIVLDEDFNNYMTMVKGKIMYS